MTKMLFADKRGFACGLRLLSGRIRCIWHVYLLEKLYRIFFLIAQVTGEINL